MKLRHGVQPVLPMDNGGDRWWEVREWMVTETSSPQSPRKRKPARTSGFSQILETQVCRHRASITTPIHKKKAMCAPRVPETPQSFRLVLEVSTSLPRFQGRRTELRAAVPLQVLLLGRVLTICIDTDQNRDHGGRGSRVFETSCPS